MTSPVPKFSIAKNYTDHLRVIPLIPAELDAIQENYKLKNGTYFSFKLRILVRNDLDDVVTIAANSVLAVTATMIAPLVFDRVGEGSKSALNYVLVEYVFGGPYSIRCWYLDASLPNTPKELFTFDGLDATTRMDPFHLASLLRAIVVFAGTQLEEDMSSCKMRLDVVLHPDNYYSRHHLPRHALPKPKLCTLRLDRHPTIVFNMWVGPLHRAGNWFLRCSLVPPNLCSKNEQSLPAPNEATPNDHAVDMTSAISESYLDEMD